MRASRILRSIMTRKNIKVKQLAEELGKTEKTIYNTFYNDERSTGKGMTFENVVEMAEVLGCEIVFRDKETGKEY